MKHSSSPITRAASYTIPLLLAGFTATANYVILHDGLFHYRNTSFVGQFLGFSLLYITLFKLIEKMLLKGKPDQSVDSSFLKRLDSLTFLQLNWSLRSVLVAACIMLVLWLPYLYFSWPGIIWYDPAASTIQYLDATRELNPANPLLVVCFIGWILQFSLNTYGTISVGVTILVLIQLILTTLSFASLVCYLQKMGIRKSLRVLLFFFLTLFPFFPGIFVTVTKDTLSVAPTVGFAIALIDAFSSISDEDFRMSTFIPTLIFALLTSLTRLANLYMVIGSLFFYALVCRSIKKGISALSIAIISFACVNMLVPTVVGRYHLIRQNAHTGSARAFAVQMVGNAARFAPEIFTEEDWALIVRCYGMDATEIDEVYDYSILDALVNAMHPEEGVDTTELSPTSPLRTLAVHALKNYPTACIGAWSGVTAQWFSYLQSPNLIAPSYTNVVPEEFKELPGYTGEIRDEPFLRDMNAVISSLPIIRLLYSKALYATFIPCLLLFMIIRAPRKQRFKLFSACVFLWLNCCYLMLCPTSRTQTGSRYLLPLIAVLPLFVAFVLSQLQNNQVKQQIGGKHLSNDDL